MQNSHQKFYIIGHNAADTIKQIRPWQNSDVSHLEIDVQQTRTGFLAMHSLVKGLFHAFRLWPFVRPLDQMINAVITQDKDVYIDYKRGNVIALVSHLKNMGIADRCTFVLYGRDQAEQLKQLLPTNDVFLHIRGKSIHIFDSKPNNYQIGICLSPKQLTQNNVNYMHAKNANILATFVNDLEDAMHALTLNITGITTDIPQLATTLKQWQNKTGQSAIAPTAVAGSTPLSL